MRANAEATIRSPPVDDRFSRWGGRRSRRATISQDPGTREWSPLSPRDHPKTLFLCEGREWPPLSPHGHLSQQLRTCKVFARTSRSGNGIHATTTTTVLTQTRRRRPLTSHTAEPPHLAVKRDREKPSRRHPALQPCLRLSSRGDLLLLLRLLLLYRLHGLLQWLLGWLLSLQATKDTGGDDGGVREEATRGGEQRAASSE